MLLETVSDSMETMYKKKGLSNYVSPISLSFMQEMVKKKKTKINEGKN